MNPKKQWQLMLVIIIVCAGAIKTCSQTEAKKAAAANETTSEPAPVAAPTPLDPASKIQGGALDDLDPAEYPKFAKKMGKKRLQDARDGQKVAALLAAKSPECDAVQIASPVMESTKKNLTFFVNCANTKQWHFTEKELKDSHGKWLTAEQLGEPGESTTERNKRERAEREANAPGSYQECEDVLRRNLKHGQSAEFHYVAGKREIVNDKGERFVSIELEALNGLGNEIPMTGYCRFTLDGKVSWEFEDR